MVAPDGDGERHRGRRRPRGEFNQTAQVATSYKAEFIEKLPVARNLRRPPC